jgi:hypothetical protein
VARGNCERSKAGADDLSVRQRARVVAKVKAFREQRFRTAITQGINDGFSFWKTLYEALNDAGRAYMHPSNGPAVGDPLASIPIVSVPGVSIWFDAPETESAAIALAQALLAERIRADVSKNPYSNAAGRTEMDKKTIQIIIGPKT